MSKKKFYFLKGNYSRNWLIRTIRGNALSSVSSGCMAVNKGVLGKNVPDTCCIDIKTMSDKEEEG